MKSNTIKTETCTSIKGDVKEIDLVVEGSTIKQIVLTTTDDVYTIQRSSNYSEGVSITHTAPPATRTVWTVSGVNANDETIVTTVKFTGGIHDERDARRKAKEFSESHQYGTVTLTQGVEIIDDATQQAIGPVTNNEEIPF